MNYEHLKNDFIFYGGTKNANDEITMELYACNKTYDSVFVMKNNP
ncbi:hypothetical protein SAMN04488524_3233 [Pedobacter africanus]|uniref:Uncharacterized protein n=1 Tax=Pedobacter africanus TaxID=151894 RepID=A0A1W2CU60_9SPHI|nr:hypothetical protein SAMN04488524_3233 [Pedobacter africanus]